MPKTPMTAAVMSLRDTLVCTIAAVFEKDEERDPSEPEVCEGDPEEVGELEAAELAGLTTETTKLGF